MAKMNNTRKSDSWRPGMVANGSGMISKNQKRKEKRYSHNLSALKSQDTPTKKAMLGPLGKFKENLNQSLNLPPVGNKENKLLSTSLPIKGVKKSNPSLKKNVKPTGILSNSNTPKLKGHKVTFNMDKNVDKFIDSEAEEGEEPVTDKVVKPYEKGSLQKQQLKRRMSMMDVEEDEDSESDDASFDSASEFVDMEASEGEETDSVDAEESYDENSDDDSLDEEADDDDENSDFDDDNEDSEEVDDDDESAEEMDSEEDEEDEDSVDTGDESEEEAVVANSSKVVVTPKRRESMAAVPTKKEKAANTPLPKKVAAGPEPATPQMKKENEKKNVNVEAVSKPKKGKVEAEVATKGKTQATVEKKIQSQEKVEKDGKKVEETVIGETSPFVGFIRKIYKKISIEDVKSALCSKVDAKKIVGLRLARDRNVFVYLKDEDTLNLLLNNSFPVTENFKFVVYKARDSASDKKPKFIAFLPKVPLTTTSEELKAAIVKYVGTDCVASVQFRRVFKHLQTRQILVHFTDVESLKKIVYKGDLQVGSAKIVFRAAYETTVDVPTYRVLITSIPEKTSEAALKKAIESQVGQNTVHNIQFSQRKSSFGFVAMKSEEAQKKALEVGKNISVNGTKLEVVEFKPRKPTKKRAAPSEQSKEKKSKAKKQKLADGTASNAPNPAKKKKAAITTQMRGASPKTDSQKPPQTPSKGAASQANTKKEAKNTPGQEVIPKSKKNKQFPKHGKDVNLSQEAQTPVKEPALGKGPNPKPEPQTSAKGLTPGKGAKSKPEPQSSVTSAAPGKSANPQQKQKKSKKGAANGQPQSPSPLKVSSNNASPSSPKHQKKNKNKQQQSPKPTDMKKQALVEKIASKKKNKKNFKRRDAS